MKKILETINKLADARIISNVDMDEKWMDEVTFSKGNIHFLIQEEEGLYNLDIYKGDLCNPDERQYLNCIFYLEDIASEGLIIEKMVDHINNKELYKQYVDLKKKQSMRIADGLHKYTKLRNDATSDEETKKYQKIMNKKLEQFVEVQKLITIATNSLDHLIISEEKGIEDRVIVKWYLPEGVKYTISTLTSTGALVLSTKYNSKAECYDEYSKKFAISKFERYLIKTMGLNIEEIRDFVKTMSEKYNVNLGYENDIRYITTMYNQHYAK